MIKASKANGWDVNDDWNKVTLNEFLATSKHFVFVFTMMMTRPTSFPYSNLKIGLVDGKGWKRYQFSLRCRLVAINTSAQRWRWKHDVCLITLIIILCLVPKQPRPFFISKMKSSSKDYFRFSIKLKQRQRCCSEGFKAFELLSSTAVFCFTTPKKWPN